MRFLRNFEKRIYSTMLKLLVAVHLSLAEILICNHVSMIYDVAMATSITSNPGQKSSFLNIFLDFFPFFETELDGLFIFTFHKHLGMILHQFSLFSDVLRKW